MSVWSKSNCIVTSKGNQALTEISAKGGTLTFDSVWTCSERVDSTALYGLTELPDKKQKMTLVKYTQVSSGYTINVQVTNEDLSAPYAIEMVGVYMKLNGFNDGNPFLYMVLLTDEGSADKMTTISRSTYKYAIYLYHTNKAVLNITLNSEDFVTTDTFEAGISEMKSDILSLIYTTDFSDASTNSDEEGYLHLYTEHYDTNPFVQPAINSVTANPILFIQNYTGSLVDGNSGSYKGIFIDEVGPFLMIPCDHSEEAEAQFTEENLLCSVRGNFLSVYNYFPREEYVPIHKEVYTDFNALPTSDGIYSLFGDAINAPVTSPSNFVWSCIVLNANGTLMCLAVSNYNNKIYRRTSSDNSWESQSTTDWSYIGGGSGVQNAEATFINASSGVPSSNSNGFRIVREDTSNALKAGDIIMCHLKTLSTLKTSTSVNITYLDGIRVPTKYIYNTDGVTKTPCCQFPNYFLLEYDGEHFHLLTPPNITTTLSANDPVSGDGKYGDIWYTY